MDTSKNKSLKQRLSKLLLYPSRSFKKLHRNPKPDQNPNPTRPIIQITIDCSGRRSVDATPPVLMKKKERRLTEGRICPPASPSEYENEKEKQNEFFSSDKEKQELISSRSFSFTSDSSEFFLRKKSLTTLCTRKEDEEEEEESGFAVVKQSVDPYKDFRSSMVEMILEKKINGSDEMRKLLEIYLELNSSEHHPVIISAFADVWDAIFPK